MKRTPLWVALILAVSLVGCTAMRVDSAVSRYREVATQVRLGQTKDEVLGMLEPTQSGLGAAYRKSPDQYREGAAVVEIHYFRSGRQADGLTTDDEFTPYVFRDGELVAIGWAVLGGPKSQGQTTPQTHINVQQNTTVH